MDSKNTKKMSINSVKTMNQRLVLKALVKSQPKTRTQISKEAMISNATAGTIIDEFAALGIVSEIKDHSTRVGRRPSLVKIEANNVITLVINLCHESMFSYRVMNVNDEELYGKTYLCTEKISYRDHLEQFLKQIKQTMIANHQLEFLAGVCISISGVYNKNSDMVMTTTTPNLKEIKLKALMGQYFGGDILIENDINLVTQSNITQAAMNKHMLFVYFKKGIGSSLLVNGNIYEGGFGFAGEIGQMTIGSDETFEQMVSWEKFEKRMIFHYNISEKADASSVIKAKYDEKDEYIIGEVKKITKTIATCFSNIIWMINPSVIYICGDFNMLGKTFISDIKATLSKTLSAYLSENTTLEYMENDILSMDIGANHKIIQEWIKSITRHL
jgi:predicted NBD/HSP70 family sugar kinase